MDFKELVNYGWQNHENDTKGVTGQIENNLALVTTLAEARQLASLINHAIGEHQGDWTKAANLIGRLVDRPGEDGDRGGLLLAQATATYLAGKPMEAMAIEATACANIADKRDDAILRGRFLVVGGLFGAGRWDEVIGLYPALLEWAAKAETSDMTSRAVAIVSNNLASNLMDMDDLSADQKILIKQAADAARVYWMKVGNWVNDERADYLLALVHNRLGDGEQALTYAERGLKTIAEADGEERVDEAFLQLARTKALRLLDRADDATQSLAAADALAAEFNDDGLTEWFQGERAKTLA